MLSISFRDDFSKLKHFGSFNFFFYIKINLTQNKIKNNPFYNWKYFLLELRFSIQMFSSYLDLPKILNLWWWRFYTNYLRKYFIKYPFHIPFAYNLHDLPTCWYHSYIKWSYEAKVLNGAVVFRIYLGLKVIFFQNYLKKHF